MISNLFLIMFKSRYEIITYPIIIAVLLMCLNCSSQDRLPSNSHQHQGIEKKELTNTYNSNEAENLLISKVKEVIQKHNLTKLSLECLLFEILDSPQKKVSFITIRELHNIQCGGDPMTSPRLFTLRINTNTGEVWTDVKSLAGKFERLE